MPLSFENEESGEDNFEDSQDEKDNEKVDIDSMPLGDLLQTHKVFHKKLKPAPFIKSSSSSSSFPEKQRSSVKQRLKKDQSSIYNFVKNAPREEPILSKPPRVVKTKNPNKIRKNDVIKRDPRFDDLSGTFSVEFFDENYKFLEEKKEEELKELRKLWKDCDDDEEKERLRRLVQKYKEERRVVDRLVFEGDKLAVMA